MSMFTGFRAYDDEGYYLASLADYLSGHPLLTQYAPVYGPFFYEVMGGLFKLLGLTPDNDTARAVTAGIWVIDSLAGGLVAFRLSRNLWLGLGAQVLTFSVLAALGNEPLSTYGMTTMLLLGLVAAATFGASRPRATGALIGAIVGALCLIKINVGGLAAIAVAFAWVAGLTPRWRRLLQPSMAAVITAVPIVLMSALLNAGWVVEFAIVVALSAAAVGAASLAALPSPFPWPSGPWIAVGGGVLAVACLAIAFASGTRPGDAWQELVVVPLQFPRLFTVPIRLNAGYDVVAAISFAAALLASVRRSTAGVSPALAGLLRIGAGFFTWASMLFMPDSTYLLALPLAWLATQAPDGPDRDPVGAFARRLVPALAVLESLQAYPIAGSQLSIAALGLVSVGAITFGDGIRQLRAAGVRAARYAPPAAMGLNLAVLSLFALTAVAGFATGTALGLPGAESVRLPVQRAMDLRQLVATVDRSCSSFVTFPGMDSFYIWTGQDPPTPARAGGWWLLLDRDQEQALVDQLTPKQRLCVIKNQRGVDMWAQGAGVPSNPLVDFIDREFVHDSSYGDYELLVRSGA